MGRYTTNRFIINLNSDGSFPINNNQIFVIRRQQYLRLQMNSRRFFQLMPYVLTNIPKKRDCKSLRLSTSLSKEIKQTTILSRDCESDKYLDKQYTILEGQFDLEQNWFCEFQCNFAGTLFIQIIFLPFNEQITQKVHIRDFAKPEYIVVEPEIILNNEILSYNQMIIQTLYPRCLGNINSWKQKLKMQNELGYNAFHFPPIQELGGSGSLYSIKDQLKYSSEIFEHQNENNEKQLKDITDYIHDELNSLCFIDILLNHTSSDSEWLIEDIDCTYNTQNTPQLRSAYALDKVLQDFNQDLLERRVSSYPKGPYIDSDEDLNLIMKIIEHEIIPRANIPSYFQFDLKGKIYEFKQYLNQKNPELKIKEKFSEQDEIEVNSNIFAKEPDDYVFDAIQESLYDIGCDPYGLKFDFKKVAQVFINYEKQLTFEILEKVMIKIQKQYIQNSYDYIKSALGAIQGTIQYQKLTLKRHNLNNWDNRILDPYFTVLKNGWVVANNGWILNQDARINFAESNAFNYLKRDIVIWGDLVKLRYGKEKNDSKFLWKRMKQYVIKMAKIFHGFRLDNAHSTPIHVAEYMMMKARKTNPNMHVFCELFTGSEEIDAEFAKKLGANALVREIQRCNNIQSLFGTLSYFGRQHYNSFGSLDSFETIDQQTQEVYNYLVPRDCHALVYDLTHDNKSYFIERTHLHQLPIMALLSFSNLFLGTTKGYDEFYYQNLSVVTEKRPYDFEQQLIQSQNGNDLTNVRKVLNSYQKLLKKDYPEMYLEQQKYDTITVMRQNKSKNHHLTLIARCSFEYDFPELVDSGFQILLPGRFEEVQHIFVISNEIIEKPFQTEESIRGCQIKVTMDKDLSKYATIDYDNHLNKSVIKFHYLPPSFVCIIKTQIQDFMTNAFEQLDKIYDTIIANPTKEQVAQFTKEITVNDINYLLYSSEHEEGERNSHGNYHIPHQGSMVYAGFGGFQKILEDACIYNSLSIPLFQNIREGNWLLDYLTGRLRNNKNLKQITEFVEQYIEYLKQIPRHEIPCYFSRLVLFILKLAKIKISQTSIISSQIKQSSFSDDLSNLQFLTNLLQSCYQFLSIIPSASSHSNQITMSAGLPHFSTGWTRCWGRDTFISFKSCLLYTGLFEQAKDIIIMFASTLRHGLIPNLLDGTRNPRYNCRDAAWFFIKSIKDYLDFTGDYQILDQQIEMVFLSDNQQQHYELKSQGKSRLMSLSDIIYNIISSHAHGIKFREWNAGEQLDRNMEYEGFNILLELDENTGFILGGNEKNCLTWMDKMGSSEKALNKGKPSTSRNGAPIEMTSLLKLALDFVQKLNDLKIFQHNSVKTKSGKIITFKEWSELIQNNFEKYYFIPKEKKVFEQYVINESAVRRGGIYKDVLFCSNERHDYQLRPNACIAFSLTPELFDRYNAASYIISCEEFLIESKSIGIKTLDPKAFEYRSFYNNEDDSLDKLQAHGASYHNGPEWVWVYGCFIKCLVQINKQRSDIHKYHKAQLMSFLANHKSFIQNNIWKSLPELTNQNGEYNQFSCPAQAWSIAMILEGYIDILSNE